MAYHMMALVPSCQKVPKVKIACSYSKEGDLYWLEDSINVTLKSLLLLPRIKKSSKPGVWLQNKRCSLMVESSSPLTLPSECRNSQVFTHSDLKMTLSFAIIVNPGMNLMASWISWHPIVNLMDSQWKLRQQLHQNFPTEGKPL